MSSPEKLEAEENSEKNNEEAQGKLKRSLSSMLEQMKMTEEESNFREEKFKEVDVVKEYSTYLKCTKCELNFQTKINKGEGLGVHPLLGVLMCDACCDYYGDGNFSMGSDNEDKYCRWCGEGGIIFACSKCICGFCDKCIQKHFGDDGLDKVKNDDDWVCYFCDSKPLWCLRSICSLAEKAAEKNGENFTSKRQKKKKKKALKKRESEERDASSSHEYNVENGKRKRSKRITRAKKDLSPSNSSRSIHEFSSSFDESTDETGKKRSRKKSTRSSKRLFRKSRTKKSSKSSSTESEEGNPKKKLKVDCASSDEEDKMKENSSLDGKKNLGLEKLRKIWKFTQIVAEVGLLTSRERLKKLSDEEKYNTLEILDKEYKKLESLIAVMCSSINTVRSSIDATLRDLNFDNMKEEKEIFQNEEIKLKNIVKKLKKDSEDESIDRNSQKSSSETETNSDGKERKNSPTPKKKKRGRPRKTNKDSPSDEEEEEDKKSKDSEEPEENQTEGVEKSKSRSRSSSKEKAKSSKENKSDEEDGKPLLKVKSFAKMTSENCLKNGEIEKIGDTVTSKSENLDNETDTDKDAPEILNKKEDDEKDEGHESDSGNEDLKTISRRAKREKSQIKANFEKFKEKRSKFLKGNSAKENGKVSKKDDSDSEPTTVNANFIPAKRTKRINVIIDTSDEENHKINDTEGSSSDESKAESKKSAEEEAKNSDSDSSKKISSSKTSSDEEDEKKKKKEKVDKKSNRRKNINKILKKESLHLETKEALKNEEERKERIQARQKLFEELFPENEDDETKRLVLDFDPETKEPTVTVHKKLMKNLKPHQIKGVRFMWDNCFESVQKMSEDSGSGCILAHCMGLGKTLQVVTLVHTIMTHDLGVNTVLIVCPLSTVSNWINEFEMWLSKIHTDPITLYDLVKYKKVEDRCFYLQDWHENGGVLVLSYDLFRTLTKTIMRKSKKSKKPKKSKGLRVFETTLLDPGPDLVICDEGHLLKNEDSALSKCMNLVKTSRRIVLTGTPLQNNLMEYHCMVQFVKPNILGTKKEFSNRFINPINNGQFEDSTEMDVKIMKRRSHVLHSMLSGCVQRYDYSVLTPFLPEKYEYVLSISLTETQAKVYRHFLDNLTAKATGASKAATLFNDYHHLQRIWTHPRTMLMHGQKEAREKDFEEDSEGSLKDFVVDTDESESSSGNSSIEEIIPARKRLLRSNANDPEMQKAAAEEEVAATKHWWDDFFKESDYEDIRASNKLVILFSLLKRWEEMEDKVLVFSQSLYSLDLIEYFLNKIDESKNDESDETLAGFKGSWVQGVDYFRLDGSSSSENRAMWCKHFNKKSNTRARLFLISTRAGGLGINLFGANRVVIFDASWNPSHDLQSIFRVYRFGQKKTCYIYRFLAEATMEEKIYERQVTKLSLAHRVVDEHQIERHYSMMNLQELYNYDPTPPEQRKVPMLPKDSVFADILAAHKDVIVKYHEHDSLLENREEEELSEEERKAAWKEYEEEKVQRAAGINLGILQQQQQFQSGFVQGMPNMNPNMNPLMNMMNAAFTYPNSSAAGQSFINPMYVHPNIPLNVLQRGIQLGVTPLYNESTESYFNRVKYRERWMQVEEGPREA